MEEKKAVPLVFFIVVSLGVVSLIIFLSDGAKYSGNVAVLTQDKSPIGILSSGTDCQFPVSTADLVAFLSERKNVPFSIDSCPLIAQDFCIVLNSGSCLRQCLKVVQSPDGVCSSSVGAEITGNVVLTPEECKRLAMSYDTSVAKVLSKVGAGTQTISANNPCSASTEPAAAKVFSVDEPLQAYAKNLFESNDITGYIADASVGQSALEYVLCRDGRSRVSIEGRSRCDTT